MRPRRLFLTSVIWLAALISDNVMAFSAPKTRGREIYNIPNSGWTSPQWRWGYGVGTGHDCAAISRANYNSVKSREALVAGLLDPPSNPSDREPANFEEVKLVLALAWQNGRWTGQDGGPGGYGEVLEQMAAASRYELGEDKERAKALVDDMAERFHLLDPLPEQQEMMDCVWDDSDFDSSQRKCCGLVLAAMGFVESG